MADFQGRRASAPANNKPKWEPDWGRIQRGEPRVAQGLDAKHLVAIKPPVKVQSVNHARDLCDKYGVKLYPSGPYEVRSDGAGQLWLQHTEWHARAAMWQFQTTAAHATGEAA